ncbi:sigma-54-dependent transcriptional regulator [Qipengyuania qiaonensis]|uniref:DNA-binding transcriptional regulator NtrC n=1 Tax=Qipengyuania qiaonensis TaxID=2867240 RepID=A0ABS7J8U5_9SPHN|nr:sigma-54 dependent transcriptional regulator [Qipengyuania qiaonensis]MBX7483681.1 sigma-54 dependent transcriptional regulator [Qipengyuania qiaonensis]
MATPEARLLMLIDDEPAQSRPVSALAARAGWRVVTCASGKDALDMLASPEGSEIHAVLLDQWVAGDATCDLIRDLRAARPETPLVILTASNSPLLAVEALRAGASDYLIKPVGPNRLLRALGRITPLGYPDAELQPLSEKLSHPVDFDAMVGSAALFRTALAKAATAARGHAHVLVEGERGTGKDMLTRAMHAASTRAKAVMRVVHCAGMPPASLESLLFGHEKGAFPGAFDRQTGLIEHCDGGTLILDDIDRLPAEQQQRLAEVLTSGIVRPTGATHGFKIDVRIIASSDLALDELVAKGEFSSDLLDQLSATRIRIPALRERLGDIPALTRYFLSLIGERPGLKHHSIADSALSLLEAYDWPGNVRQLQAALFRACVFEQREALTAHSFPQLAELIGDKADRGESRARGLGVLLYTEDGNVRPLEEIEADVIRLAIGHYRGRMTEVARRLGIGRSTLYRKLAELGIDDAA